MTAQRALHLRDYAQFRGALADVVRALRAAPSTARPDDVNLMILVDSDLDDFNPSIEGQALPGLLRVDSYEPGITEAFRRLALLEE